MRKQTLFKLAAMTFMVFGTLAAVSCKKEKNETPVTPEQRDTTGGESVLKAVKGTTRIELYVDTTVVNSGGSSYYINDSILQIFDINVTAIAGNETKSDQLTGKTLALEASTTTIPSYGQIDATITPKESFRPDSAKMYSFGLVCKRIYSTTYENGTVESDTSITGKVVNNKYGFELTASFLESAANYFKYDVLKCGTAYKYMFQNKSVTE